MSRRSYIAKEQKQKGGGDIACAFLREESHHVSYHRHLLTTSSIDSRTHHVIDTLDAFVDANETLSQTENTLVIGGDCGCGKSTILAHWVDQRRKMNPDSEFIIYHHAQASDEAMKIPHALERWIWLMGRYMRVSGEHPQINSLIEGTTSEALLMQRFSRFCTMLTSGFRGPSGKGGYNGFSGESSKTKSSISEQPRDKQRFILVVDGADLMRLEDGTESLRWLPTKLPKSVSVIMSLSLPGPLKEKKSTSQKIDVSKSLLKLPAHLQEQLCFRVVKMASYLRPEYKSMKAKTLGECWRRNYFYYSLAKMTLAEQREFISNYLSRRASDYDKLMSRNEQQFQSVVSRPTFRHTKAKHEVQRLCRETGPTSSPQVMVILLQAACLAAAEDVQSDVMDCFSAVSEQPKDHVTKQLQLELFSKFYMLVEKAIHRACKKLELPVLSKSNFLDGADDVELKVTFFQAIIGLLGASRFGLQQVELWNCLETMNAEWQKVEVQQIRSFVMWVLRFQIVSVQYDHRDPDNADKDEESEGVMDTKKSVGFSLFQAVKLKNISRNIKKKQNQKKNEPWWYLTTKSGSTMWCQQLMNLPSSSIFWQAYMQYSPDNEKVTYAAHRSIASYFINCKNKQRAVEELTLHGLLTEDWIMLKRLTVQIPWFLQFWRSEGGVNRRDLVRLWCAKSEIVPSSPLNTRFDIVKEYVHAVDSWWERVRLSNNGDQNAADKSTSVVLKDVYNFLNACVMLYHNRYSDTNVYPEFDRTNIMEFDAAFRIISYEVNESMSSSTGSRRRAESIEQALEEVMSPKKPRSPTTLLKGSTDYCYDSDEKYTGDAARFASWLKRWEWVQIPYQLMINSFKGAGIFRKAIMNASHTLKSNNVRYKQISRAQGRLPAVSSPATTRLNRSNSSKPTPSKQSKGNLARSPQKKKNTKSKERDKVQEKETFLNDIKTKLKKRGKAMSVPRLLTKDDVTMNPLDVLKMGKYGASEQKEQMIKLLEENILDKQKELSAKKAIVRSLEEKIRQSVQEIRDLTLVDDGVSIDPITGKPISPSIIHAQQRLDDVQNKQITQQWLSLFFERLKKLCEDFKPDNIDYIKNAGQQVAMLNFQIEEGQRNLEIVNSENHSLQYETLPSYVKNVAEYKGLNKKTLKKIERGVDAIHREEQQRMERIKKKEQYLRDMENARKKKRMIELQESQMQQAMLSMGLASVFDKGSSKKSSKLSKAEIRKAIKAANVPSLITRLEKAGIEEPAEILPKLLAQGRSFHQMDKNSKELEKTKEDRTKQLHALKEKLYEMEFGSGSMHDPDEDEDANAEGKAFGRRQAIRMTQGHLFRLQSQLFKQQENKLKKKASRKQELLDYDTKISKLESQARIFRERLIHDIGLLNNVEHGLMHLSVLTGSEEAKTILLTEANSDEDFTSDSDSDDDYTNKSTKRLSQQSNTLYELKEKSSTGFRASIKSKYAMRKIMGKIIDLQREMKEVAEKKKRNQRRSVITGEVLESITATSLKKRRTSAEKKDYETKMQQDYYADGMPIPRRPISRIVDVRRNALDIAAAERDPTLSNDEDKWWEDALFQSSSNAARRKVQEKKQKEKERAERAKRQAIQRELELKRKKEEEQQRQIELKLWREAEEKRLAEEAERKKLEEEIKRRKKQKKRGKKKKYRSQSMYATRKSKSQKVKSSVRTNSNNASEIASSTVERKNAY